MGNMPRIMTDGFELSQLTKKEAKRLDDYLQPGEWMVCTDQAADDSAKGEILSNLWAFRPEFLAGETNLPVEVFAAIQNNGRCEDNNEAMLALVKSTCGKAEIVSAAIAADGRGHFLSPYDGDEKEFRTKIGRKAVTLYCYRQN